MSDEYTTAQCPKCGDDVKDFDGFGVLAHDRCGYCSHPSVDDDTCGICQATVVFGELWRSPWDEKPNEDLGNGIHSQRLKPSKVSQPPEVGLDFAFGVLLEFWGRHWLPAPSERLFKVFLCGHCVNAMGEQCHTPGCYRIRQAPPDWPLSQYEIESTDPRKDD